MTINADFSYSNDSECLVSLYFKPMSSMIVESSFMDLLTMLNGMFSFEEIKEYMLNVLNYSTKKCNEIFESIEKMSILEHRGQMSNWGSELKTSFNKNYFFEYFIAFPCLSKEQIDLAIMSSKYWFKEIVLSEDVMMTKEIISGSMILSYADENRLLSDILIDRYRATTIIDKSIKSSYTIISLIKPNDIIDFDLNTHKIQNRHF